MSTYSEEERRRAEKRIEAVRRGQGGDLRGIYKGIAIDLQCDLNRAVELLWDMHRIHSLEWPATKEFQRDLRYRCEKFLDHQEAR